MDLKTLISGLLFLLVVFLLKKAIYRTFLSPISHFPGPRLAALTFWYEGYYDVIKDGRYTWKIKELHEKYGPIVRINPYELHVNDAEFYQTLYSGASRRTDKWLWSAKMFGTTKAIVGTTDHDLHQMRKQAIAPYFSKTSVARLEPLIQRKVDRLCERLKEFQGTEKPVNLSDVFMCFSADVIGSYVFGTEYKFLESKDFNPGWRKLMTELSRSTHLMKQFGWLYAIFTNIPEWVVGIFHPLSKQLFQLRRNLARSIEDAKRLEKMPYGAENHSPLTPVFTSLLTAAKSPLPASEISISRLTDEGLTLLGAGTVTTAQILSNTLYYVLVDQRILSILQSELETATSSSSQPSWSTLSQLPYLTAVLTEGLRLSYGVSHRLPRISPNQPLHLGDHIIPAGTPVSMTQMFLHDDPSLFPNPSEFRPERWLPDPSSSASLSASKRFFVPFSRGTRSCLGTNLAWAELYLCIAGLLRPSEKGGVQMRLWKTGVENVKVEHDYFNPAPGSASVGVRVLVG